MQWQLLHAAAQRHIALGFAPLVQAALVFAVPESETLPSWEYLSISRAASCGMDGRWPEIIRWCSATFACRKLVTRSVPNIPNLGWSLAGLEGREYHWPYPPLRRLQEAEEQATAALMGGSLSTFPRHSWHPD